MTTDTDTASSLQTADFDYELPPALIAQRPLPDRDRSRLLVLDRASDRLQLGRFADLLQYLRPGDIVVANDSRVIPARLFGSKPGGGRAEILLLEEIGPKRWLALVGGKRLGAGSQIRLRDRQGHATAITATVVSVLDGPVRELLFSEPLAPQLVSLGHTPLPPYIQEKLDDPERYQTLYARQPGSAAAPTAGLHFSAELLLALRYQGVLFETCTLHVGLDTFKPVTAARVGDHTIHSERATLSAAAARRINEASLAGGRIVAVGTTSARVLETAALRSAGINGPLANISQRDQAGETYAICPWKPVAAFSGSTDLFIFPGYRFRAIDALITNFHLPRSSLIMLVSAFAGRERVLQAYERAVKDGFRFYSFGDAMLIT